MRNNDKRNLNLSATDRSKTVGRTHNTLTQPPWFLLLRSHKKTECAITSKQLAMVITRELWIMMGLAHLQAHTVS